ncbi:universal stress protein [Variovorax sp.]|uniref:universal stress protein n=1 Tax=Variovorax sp. TaxID=1871043 RepID=UPI002D4ED73A|nr:universal stress protein [Variovorax sp.]HYP85982.1 universal stress protein [Variovorax sp.]
MYRRILVAIDGSPTAACALEEALRLAKLGNARLCLLHVVDEMKHLTGYETFTAYAHDVLPRLRAGGELVLKNAAEHATRADVEADCALFMASADRVCDVVVAKARSWGADLIVIGTHGRHGLERFFLGSDAEQILRQAPVPVLLVRGGANQPPTRTGSRTPGAGNAGLLSPGSGWKE